MRQNVEARADAIRLSILDLEAQRGPALLHGAVERRLVLLPAHLVERAREAISHVGEGLGRRLDDVDVVAVRLFGLTAFGAVVPLLRVAYLLEQAARLVLGEDVQLPRDHVGEAPATEDHTS